MKLLRTTALTAALMTAAVPSLTSPAHAWGWGWRGGGWGWGGVGVGLAAGALIGGAIAASSYAYGYPAYGYGYGYPAYGYGYGTGYSYPAYGYGYGTGYKLPITPLSDAISMPLLPVSIIIVIGTNAGRVRALNQPGRAISCRAVQRRLEA